MPLTGAGPLVAKAVQTPAPPSEKRTSTGAMGDTNSQGELAHKDGHYGDEHSAAYLGSWRGHLGGQEATYWSVALIVMFCLLPLGVLLAFCFAFGVRGHDHLVSDSEEASEFHGAEQQVRTRRLFL